MGELIIKVKDVRLAIRACSQASEKAKESAAADEIKKSAMLAVFERLIGVKSEKELAAYSLEEIEKLARRRVKKGEVELEGFTLEELLKVIKLSAARRNVSWKDAFIAELGEGKAQEMIKGTVESHSFKFVDGELGKAKDRAAHCEAVGAMPAGAAK